MTVDFDSATLPWVDRGDFEAELAERLAAGTISEGEAMQLRSWRKEGFYCFRGLIDRKRVEALKADIERAWTQRVRLQALVEGLGVGWIEDLPPREEFSSHHYRLLDVQDWSQVARDILLDARLINFVRLVLDETPVAMQTLFFDYSSEQGGHQDFPYVHAQTPSHLLGCWIACEPVDDTNGALIYFPGSHRLPKFDWNEGLSEPNLLFDGVDPEKDVRFQAFLRDQVEAHDLPRLVFHAEPGDVVFWHAALVHAGGPVSAPELTRKSFVAHYSDVTSYSRDRRQPEQEPIVYERNGGRLYLREPVAETSGLARRLIGKVSRLFG